MTVMVDTASLNVCKVSEKNARLNPFSSAKRAKPAISAADMAGSYPKPIPSPISKQSTLSTLYG
jgi:hypothetical protein